MKRKTFWTYLLWIMAFSWLILPEVKADQKDKDAEFEGDWNEGLRSIPQGCPVSITLSEASLMISTTSDRSDITIRIVKDAIVVYEETIYRPQTATTISLDLLDKGVYRMELTNQWGDFLFGTFEK